MVPTALMKQRAATAIANDPAALADVGGLHVHLITTDFTPGDATDFTTLDEATFAGGAAKLSGLGAQTAGRDPISGRQKIIIEEPVGGWTWICTAPAGAGPETVVGYVVTDLADVDTFGAARLPNPVTVAAAGDIVSIGEVSFLMAANPLE